MKITPIDIIKDMSGKVCSHSHTHIALNHSSGKMFTSKLCNPYTGDPSRFILQTLNATETCTLQAPSSGVYLVQVGDSPAQRVVVAR